MLTFYQMYPINSLTSNILLVAPKGVFAAAVLKTAYFNLSSFPPDY